MCMCLFLVLCVCLVFVGWTVFGCGVLVLFLLYLTVLYHYCTVLPFTVISAYCTFKFVEVYEFPFVSRFQDLVSCFTCFVV